MTSPPTFLSMVDISPGPGWATEASPGEDVVFKVPWGKEAYMSDILRPKALYSSLDLGNSMGPRQASHDGWAIGP